MNTEHTFYNKDDEIDLFELAGKLYRHKSIILLYTLVAGVIAALVALFLPKIFSANAVISQSSYGQFQQINTLILDVLDATDSQISSVNNRQNNKQSSLLSELTITPEKAYNLFEGQLTSQLVHRQAFEYSFLAKQSSSEAERRDAYDAFKKNLSISLDTKANTPRLTITYNSQDPSLAAYIVNEKIIKIAQRNIIESLEKNQTNLINSSINTLENDIKALEAAFKANNLLEITQLKEALAQAKSAGILSPHESNSSITNETSYLLGSTLLESRINQIQQRENVYRFYTDRSTVDNTSKPYIKGVSEKVYLINHLSQLNPDLSSLQPVVIEQQALEPITPIKPKKGLIVALGIILGGMLGVFIALIRIAINDRKNKKHNFKEGSLTLGG
ncbi:hypothetical protein ACH42_15410 [Endozoicomonas sp. (ex Bugula neritina AB1)]|nr:hypothetical protein ACH42_15410 [Endozoicomonas sp. (ex Bugula neritina AB1)]